MDTLKRYLFWVLLLLVLAVSVGWYFLSVPSIQAEKDGLKKKCEDANREVMKWAGKAKSKEILNAHYARQAETFSRNLKEQEQEVLKLWKEKKLVLGPKFLNAPGVDQISDFNLTWMGEVRKEILDEAQRVNLRLPADFEPR